MSSLSERSLLKQSHLMVNIWRLNVQTSMYRERATWEKKWMREILKEEQPFCECDCNTRPLRHYRTLITVNISRRFWTLYNAEHEEQKCCSMQRSENRQEENTDGQLHWIQKKSTTERNLMHRNDSSGLKVHRDYCRQMLCSLGNFQSCFYQNQIPLENQHGIGTT